jgi:hypothetical protein
VDITWERWTALSDAEARALAQRIADRVGAESFEVKGHEYADRVARTAVFDLDGIPFALIAAQRAQVGYDADRFRPTPDQVASYRESAEEFGIDDDINAYVAERTSAARTVSVPALLVAVEAAQAGLTVMPVDEPAILRRVEELLQQVATDGSAMPRQVTWSGFGRALLDPDGSVRAAWMFDNPSYDDEVARLASLGQRLLTPDEWEHACGANATTLFRWGDTYPDGGDPWSARTGPHREPNLFGLATGQDPYRDERTADPTVICGGDGGSMVCGGSGEFVSWLTVATAYRDADYAQFIQDEGADLDQMLVRPAIPLSD